MSNAWRTLIQRSSSISRSPSFFGSSSYMSFARTVATTSSRNVDAFSPILNTFAAQYVMAEDRSSIIQNLANDSGRCGFSVLNEAITSYLSDPNATASINLYSTLVISAIQVKDDVLLNFFLEDMDKYIEVNSKNVYEVLRRVCHYRRYPAFVRFLNAFIDVHFLVFIGSWNRPILKRSTIDTFSR